MTSLSDQLRWNEAARQAAISVEATTRTAVAAAFDEEDSDSALETRLASQIIAGYESGSSIGRQKAMQTVALPGWVPPAPEGQDYLTSLVSDLRRNLRSYRTGELTFRQTVLRVQHSAGVAVHRGLTDQTVAAYAELYDEGFNVRKYWVANFNNNTPCAACTRLHGTAVGIEESFSVETGEPGVYRDLVGPPRHPNCKCSLFVHITNLDRATEAPNFEIPQESPQMMSTADVKKMPKGIFAAIKATLKAIVSFFRRRR